MSSQVVLTGSGESAAHTGLDVRESGEHGTRMDWGGPEVATRGEEASMLPAESIVFLRQCRGMSVV